MRVQVTQTLKRWHRFFFAILLLFVTVLPLLQMQSAGAYGLLASRSITMDSSAEGDTTVDANNDTDPDGTNVTYHVRFDVATTTDFGGIVVEFCDNTPIIGDTNCTAISGFTITGTPAVSGQSNGSNTDPVDGVTGNCNLSTFTTANDITSNTLVLTAATPVTLTAGQTCFFDLTTVTNPNTPNHTFFARIYTYSEAAEAAGYTLANPNAGTGTVNDFGANANNDDDYIDAGGIAMSTAAQITVTAKVPEKLTFCVYTPDASGYANNDCTNKSSTGAITLGDINGVLSDVEEFVNTDSRYTIATNALYGVAIRVKGGTLKTTPSCSEAATQTCSIDAIGATALINAPGTEQFGFCTYQLAGSGITPAAPYNDAECNTAQDNSGIAGDGNADNAADNPEDLYLTQFAFDNNVTDGTVSTYGDIFANKAAGTFSTGVLAFLGNITTTTEPGIYTTTLMFIATGTY